MSAVALLVLTLLLLIVAYHTYAATLGRWLGVDDARPTPAHAQRDDVDYVPAKAPVLLGHHFASIAGAGPIVGPVFAATFGWVPVYLWLLVGGVFIGAVHDFTSLMASIRHRGRSIGEIINAYVGTAGKRLFLMFSFSAMLLVIAVFTQIIANTFITEPATATASVLFIPLAVFFGLAIYRRGLPLGPTSLVGVALLFACIWIGLEYPLSLSFNAWVVILMVYVWLASVTPVWILLQPRDYLNSFLLYALVAGGFIGVFFARPDLNLQAFGGIRTSIGWMFPVLFVTVACGAISGFHSLVASGTTSKQLDREADAKFVGYGGMLIEVLLAVIALLAAASLSTERFQAMWDQGLYVPIFSEGVGSFIAAIPVIGLAPDTARTFSALAVSAFALTTLDTCTRLARYSLQELFEPSRASTTASAAASAAPLVARNRYVATTITVALSVAFLFSGRSQALWPVFGSANQLLAALALLAVSVWLAQAGRRYFYALVPMVFMFAVTLTALALLAWEHGTAGHYLIATVALLLFAVAIVLAVLAIRRLSAIVSAPVGGAVPALGER